MMNFVFDDVFDGAGALLHGFALIEEVRGFVEIMSGFLSWMVCTLSMVSMVSSLRALLILKRFSLYNF